MVFNSFSYLLFFVGVVSLYYLTPYRWRWVVILVGSYFFYMSWSPAYGLLLFGTTLLDWLLGLQIAKEKVGSFERKAYLTVGIVLNLGVLFFYKYFDFLSQSIWSLFGVESVPLTLGLLLPIGISFYTFQSIAYMVDVYRNDLPSEKSFFRYATFVSFFPHLVSGPILRPANILPQVHEKKEWNSDNFKMGLFLIAMGLIKKIVIADRLGSFVNQVYLQPESFSGATLLVATYFFAFEIYCDFSGYTDIAIGSALILGYTIPENFRQPYFSLSITEFWRRWHISLSSWLREYLYIPLGGNRKGRWHTYFNLLITMLLGGLWHGAAWTFVIWGLIHGLYLAVERFFSEFCSKQDEPSRFPIVTTLSKAFFTFNLVAFSWIFFRATSIADAIYIVKSIFTNFGTLVNGVLPLTSIVFYFVMIALLLSFEYLQIQKNIVQKILGTPWYIRWAFVYAVIFVLIFFGAETSIQFIYFQF